MTKAEEQVHVEVPRKACEGRAGRTASVSSEEDAERREDGPAKVKLAHARLQGR